AHDRRRGAVRHRAQVVDRLAVADAPDQLDVLVLVRLVVLGAGGGSGPFAAGSVPPPPARPGGTGPPYTVRNVFGATWDLPAHAHHMDIVGVFVVNGEMVVDVAELRAGALLPTAHADRADGVGVQRPVDHVEVMDVLLDDVVAGQPGEVEPVAQLPFQ